MSNMTKWIPVGDVKFVFHKNGAVHESTKDMLFSSKSRGVITGVVVKTRMDLKTHHNQLVPKGTLLFESGNEYICDVEAVAHLPEQYYPGKKMPESQNN